MELSFAVAPDRLIECDAYEEMKRAKPVSRRCGDIGRSAKSRLSHPGKSLVPDIAWRTPEIVGEDAVLPLYELPHPG